MRIEHLGFLVEKPISMGQWWVENLGFRVVRQSGDDFFGVCFLQDASGTIIEFGKIPEQAPLNFRALLPLQVHIAIECPDTLAEAARLVNQGASLIGESPMNDLAHEKLLMRDPFGAVIQLVNRKDKLIK